MTPQERQALMTVRDKLRSGEIPAERFDMSYFGSYCGSAHCIGGWTALEINRDDYSHTLHKLLYNTDRKFRPLFYPDENGCGEGFNATPHQAAQAIDNFLEDGDPKWREVMSAEEGE